METTIAEVLSYICSMPAHIVSWIGSITMGQLASFLLLLSKVAYVILAVLAFIKLIEADSLSKYIGLGAMCLFVWLVGDIDPPYINIIFLAPFIPYYTVWKMSKEVNKQEDEE